MLHIGKRIGGIGGMDETIPPDFLMISRENYISSSENNARIGAERISMNFSCDLGVIEKSISFGV